MKLFDLEDIGPQDAAAPAQWRGPRLRALGFDLTGVRWQP